MLHSGSHNISEPRNSRLVSLVKPDQGVLSVVYNFSFPKTQDFGETTYVFNTGTTFATAPSTALQT